MRLYEFEAKKLFSENNIPVPPGLVVSNPGQIEDFVRQNQSVVLKSQVLVGGRGKAGGIKFAENPREARTAAEELLNGQIRGFRVTRLTWRRSRRSKKSSTWA